MEKKTPSKRISAYRVIVTSFFVDISDIIVSFIVALLSGSIVMYSELFEGISDLAASGLLYIGLQRSNQKANRSYPFGYGREIYFWTLLAGLVMFSFTSTFAIYFGWNRIMHPQEIHNIYLAYFSLGLAFITNGYAFWLSLKRLLKNRNLKRILSIFVKSSLIETKTTFILDLMGTTASLLGLITLIMARVTGDSRYDGVGAIGIGVVTAIFAFFLILGIKDLLIGKSASKNTEQTIRKATMKIPEVKDVLDLKTMHIGSERLLVNMEVHLQDDLTTDEIENLIDKIKLSILKEVPSARHIQVELETPGK